MQSGGVPGRTRTDDPLVKSQMLLPTELRVRFFIYFFFLLYSFM